MRSWCSSCRPTATSIQLSLTLFVGLIVGGVASIAGPIFGAIFIEFIPNIAEEISKAAPSAVYGVILIFFMFLMPSGVWGFLRPRIRRLLAGAGGPSSTTLPVAAAPKRTEPGEPARAMREPGE